MDTRLTVGRVKPFLDYTDYVKIVSAKGPNPSFFPFLGDFYLTWGLLGLGLGPGLDNFGI